MSLKTILRAFDEFVVETLNNKAEELRSFNNMTREEKLKAEIYYLKKELAETKLKIESTGPYNG